MLLHLPHQLGFHKTQACSSTLCTNNGNQPQPADSVQFIHFILPQERRTDLWVSACCYCAEGYLKTGYLHDTRRNLVICFTLYTIKAVLLFLEFYTFYQTPQHPSSLFPSLPWKFNNMNKPDPGLHISVIWAFCKQCPIHTLSLGVKALIDKDSSQLTDNVNSRECPLKSE